MTSELDPQVYQIIRKTDPEMNPKKEVPELVGFGRIWHVFACVGRIWPEATEGLTPKNSREDRMSGLSGEEEVSILELLLICGKLSFVTLTTVHKHMGKTAVGQSGRVAASISSIPQPVVLTPFFYPLPFNITLHLT